MQRLNLEMLDRYDIPERRPAAVNAVQFGASDALLGVADRLLCEAGTEIGIALVRPGPAPAQGQDPAALLREQDGLYTVLARGSRNEEAVRREIVVQSILRVPDGDAALDALAREGALALGIIDAGSVSLNHELAAALRLLRTRREAGLDGLTFLCLGEDAACASRVREGLAARCDDAGLANWIASANDFCPALAEGFVRRADAKEAARVCAEMNYADGMLHLAEPFARLTVQATASLRARRLLADAEGIRLVDDISPAMAAKARLFDAGLFAVVAPGWLLGYDTLSDCMKHEKLRAFAGRTYYEELLPADDEARRAAAPYVIETFERFENPLNRSDLLRVGRHLLGRFERGALPAMRAWAAERFEPPRRLSFALAATIMLCAGARQNADGRYEVLRGTQIHTLDDDPAALAVFSTLSHDMPPEALAYAVLADRELWHGADLREIDGLEQRVALDIARLQREPGYLPEE